MNRNLLFIVLLFSGISTAAQTRVFGKITNSKMEPLAFASVQVKEYQHGVMTREDGSYELKLEEGHYELVVSMVGYKTQVQPIIIRKTALEQNIILEAADAATLSGVTIKARDKAEEYVRNVIRHKEEVENAAGAYSCKVYIKATQQDSIGLKKTKKSMSDSAIKAMPVNSELNRMGMAEIVLNLDHETDKKIKEERTGVTKRGNSSSLFFLSTTEADFNIYDNLVRIPSISATAFISPLSYSGLMAYRFKTIKTETIAGKKIYTISVRPRQLSNATMEGEIRIIDGLWVVHQTKLRLPAYHLSEYDLFEVRQQYEWVNEKAWMITRQEFIYNAVSDKMKASGRTVAIYTEYELNKQFDKKHFGTELSTATQQAYDRDSSFWQNNRTEPLTEKEVRFIHYKDSVYSVINSKAYLDSLDRRTNKLTWQNVLYKGQELNDHTRRRHMRFPALPELFQPLQMGGPRLEPNFSYSKTWASRKNLVLFANFSYGFRNRDLNGGINLSRMYNPFNRGYYSLRLEKEFAYIFSGDAWINMLKRSNLYLNQVVGAGHGLELANGLFLHTDIDIAFRRSVSHLKTGDQLDSIFGEWLDNNQAVAFTSYTALYGKLRLAYTPFQRYIREPREKVILGSSWPTFYVEYRKGIPGIFNSKVDFDYLEFGMKQSVNLGVMGISAYSVKTGSFFSRRDLRLVDYKFQRRGDPLLLLNPSEAFQSLDSTFPTFKRFYEGHLVHEFNGAFLNKIPFFKKIGLREVAGAGFLIAPERDLRYGELFAGVERVFKYPFHLLGKFKLGVYVVGSAANQFHNPVQFKIGITAWDRKKGKWF
jgi:hypothetical protein